MTKTATKAKTPGKARKSPTKLVFLGVEIQRPPVPPTTPLARIRRGAKIAVEQYARDLAAAK